MKYIKWLSPLFIIITLISLVGCSAQDPVEKWYSEGLMPGSSTSNNTIGDNASPFDIGAFKKLYITDNTSLLDFAGNPISFGGGSSDHATLSHLDYVSAGHTGFEPAISYSGNPLEYLNGLGAFSVPAGGAGGNVTASANLTDHTIIRGDGGALGVQDSGVTIDDSDNLNTNGGDVTGFDINADNDVNVTNDLEVTDDAFVGGNLELVGTANITGGLSANLDFNQYTAIAMVCDKGATVPVTPVAGQWFYHTPTGRNILMMYNGTTWSPIISTGSMTVYVDATDGTDDINYGTGVDADAVATVQYAVNLIPGSVGGNVIININAESYAETVTIQGKQFTGSYTITLQGTLTAHETHAQTASLQGATTNFGTISDTTNDPFAGHEGDLLYSSNNAQYRVIDSVTTEVATIVGYWSAAPTGDYTIYQWGTTIQNIKISAIQQGIIVNNINIGNTQAVSLECDTGSSSTYYRCKIDSTVSIAALFTSSTSSLFQCNVTTSVNYCVYGRASATIELAGCKITPASNSGIGVYLSSSSSCWLPVDWSMPCSIDGTAGANEATAGVYVQNGFVTFEGQYNKIRDCDIGVAALQGGQAVNTSGNQYSGNAANESATAASYGYID
jgi:hypothetical protein